MEKHDIKTFVGGVGVGIVGGAIVAFSAGWIVTTGSAASRAADAANAATVAALTPACVERGLAHNDQLATIREASSYKRRSMVEKAGWVNVPEGASYSLKRDMAAACADGLMAAAE